jgi:hypothetical protein
MLDYDIEINYTKVLLVCLLDIYMRGYLDKEKEKYRPINTNIRYDICLYKPDHAMEKCLCIQLRFWKGRHNDGPATIAW